MQALDRMTGSGAKINTLPPEPTAEQREKFEALIRERQQWAHDRHSPLKADGTTRWSYGAHCGKLGCALAPRSVATDVELGLPIVQDAPDPATAPTVCSGRTVQLRVTTDAQRRAMKMHQKHY
jgi:hypothetical protein